MKHKFHTATLIAISVCQLAFFNSTFANGKSHKEADKKSATSKEFIKTDAAVSKASSANNMSMEIAKDTAYYNGKPVLVQIPFSAEKHNKYFTITNLNGEKLAFLEVGLYLNGQTFYTVNFLQNNQCLVGSLYESTGEVIELLGQFMTDGKITAGNVMKLAKENKLTLKENVAFKYPSIKSLPGMHKTNTTPNNIYTVADRLQ